MTPLLIRAVTAYRETGLFLQCREKIESMSFGWRFHFSAVTPNKRTPALFILCRLTGF
jgi:hypothetical protein